MVELAPGLQMRLRGAGETYAAAQRQFIQKCSCINCPHGENDDMYCIRDAEYVLCHACREITPLANGQEGGGVGLGFRAQDLEQWRNETLSSSD